MLELKDKICFLLLHKLALLVHCTFLTWHQQASTWTARRAPLRGNTAICGYADCLVTISVAQALQKDTDLELGRRAIITQYIRVRSLCTLRFRSPGSSTHMLRWSSRLLKISNREPPATKLSDWQTGRQQNYRRVRQVQQYLLHLQHDCSCRSEPERQVVIESQRLIQERVC